MEEKQIIDLYFARSEQAIAETDKKYGSYCRQVAYNIGHIAAELPIRTKHMSTSYPWEAKQNWFPRC